MKKKVLGPEFFNRNARVVARDLLGKYLCRKVNGETLCFKIVETESYEGLKDKASHAHRGQTPRNTPMFGKAGTIYVYFTYGMHWMLNLTCDREGYPSAVLVRGIEGAIGPARLTKKLGIDKLLTGKMLGKKTGLWVEERETEKLQIQRTPRIGIDSSGPEWSQKLYRFVLK